MMRLKVDTSLVTSVAVCRCGWRDIAESRLSVLLKAAEHERRCHPRDMHARVMLWELRNRLEQQPA